MQLSEKTKRRKANEAAFRKLRAKQAKISGRKPVRDEAYRAWIRSLPCLLCYEVEWRAVVDDPQDEAAYGFLVYRSKVAPWSRGIQEQPTEAAHSGPHGCSQKASDHTCIPLCSHRHHQHGPESYHRLGRYFFDHHGLNRETIISALRARYEFLKKGAA